MIGAYILIIGAMKSGTTTLFAQLAQHPAIAAAKPKEPGFFAFEEVHAMGWDWYEGLFGFDADRHRFALEGSTDYTKLPFTHGTTDRLRAAEAEGRRFKLLYIMRDPLSRIESHARHVQRVKMEVGRNRSPRADHSLDAGISPVNLAISDYADQLAPYADWWDRGDLKLLSLEELTTSPEAVMADIGAFLGLRDLGFTPDVEKQNEAGSKRELPALAQAARRAGPIKAIKGLVPKDLKRSAIRSLKTEVEVNGRFTLTAEERSALTPRYAAQYAALQDRYSFSAPWSFEDEEAAACSA